MKNESTYTISVSLNGDILEIILTGELTSGSHVKIVSDVASAIRKNSATRVSIDISALKGRLGMADSYQYVRNFPSHIYNMHFAMVNVHGQDEIERFQETTALNAGIKVKWFTDIDTARAWLKSK